MCENLYKDAPIKISHVQIITKLKILEKRLATIEERLTTIEKQGGKMSFNPEFPETYNWHSLDSIRLSALAVVLSNRILKDIETPERGLVTGLREALRQIAIIAMIGHNSTTTIG